MKKEMPKSYEEQLRHDCPALFRLQEMLPMRSNQQPGERLVVQNIDPRRDAQIQQRMNVYDAKMKAQKSSERQAQLNQPGEIGVGAPINQEAAGYPFTANGANPVIAAGHEGGTPDVYGGKQRPAQPMGREPTNQDSIVRAFAAAAGGDVQAAMIALKHLAGNPVLMKKIIQMSRQPTQPPMQNSQGVQTPQGIQSRQGMRKR